MSLVHPYIYAAFLGAGLMVGAFMAWLVASPPTPACTSTGDESNAAIKASRARYFAADGHVERAWGPWTLVVARSSIASAPYMVIGIDTETRCEAAMGVLIAALDATATCVQSADDQTRRTAP